MVFEIQSRKGCYARGGLPEHGDLIAIGDHDEQPEEMNAVGQESDLARHWGYPVAIGEHDYLLEGHNTLVRRFANDLHDHVEIATASLKRIIPGPKLTDDHGLGSQNLVLFPRDSENNQTLVDDLIANGFPHCRQPFPDEKTLNSPIEHERALLVTPRSSGRSIHKPPQVHQENPRTPS